MQRRFALSSSSNPSRFSYARGPLSWGTGSVSESQNTSRAAEVAATAELGRREWQVNAGRTADLIASQGDRQLHIEVKAAQAAPRDGGQVLLAGAPGEVDCHVFVALDEQARPTEYWIVPEAVVRERGHEGVLQAADVEDLRNNWEILDSIDADAA
jgi:hypothetical protein